MRNLDVIVSDKRSRYIHICSYLSQYIYGCQYLVLVLAQPNFALIQVYMWMNSASVRYNCTVQVLFQIPYVRQSSNVSCKMTPRLVGDEGMVYHFKHGDLGLFIVLRQYPGVIYYINATNYRGRWKLPL